MQGKSSLKKLTVLIVLVLLLTGCGGGSGSGSDSSGNSSTTASVSSAPLPASSPLPATHADCLTEVSGSVMKGVLITGKIDVYAIDNPDASEQMIATGSTDADGHYKVSVNVSTNETVQNCNRAVRVVVSGRADGSGLMKCDFSPACLDAGGNSVAFGDSFAIDEQFKMSAVALLNDDETSVNVNLTPLTHIVSKFAGGSSSEIAVAASQGSQKLRKTRAELRAAIEEANQRVADYFRLQGVISKIPTLDITNSSALLEADGDAQLVAFISAAMLGVVVNEGSADVGPALDRIAERFVAQADSDDARRTLLSLFTIARELTEVLETDTGIELANLRGQLSILSAPLAIQFAENDEDADGVADAEDNCPGRANADQADADADNVGDVCDPLTDLDADGVDDKADNCPAIANADQRNTDRDSMGDACDDDKDGDDIDDGVDNCPLVANRGQVNTDHDSLGDACDDLIDVDKDGIADAKDNCPDNANAGQEDDDRDRIGNACDNDADNDGVPDVADNCVSVRNLNQANTDGDDFGDACDTLIDNDRDGVANKADNCPDIANPNQRNTDGDQSGDACDALIDSDGDGVSDALDAFPSNAGESADNDGDNVGNNRDNCRNTINPTQSDVDGDGIGDACDSASDFFLGGEVSGLLGTVTLDLNGGSQSLSITNLTRYQFAQRLVVGQTYTVTISEQAVGQVCVLANASGTVGPGPVTDININCEPLPFVITVSQDGLNGVVEFELRNNTTASEPLAGLIDSAEPADISFAGNFSYRDEFTLTITRQPEVQTCTPESLTDNVPANDLLLRINCTAIMVTLSGTISGLSGSLGLALNALPEVLATMDAPVSFELPKGSLYDLLITSQPPGQLCGFTKENASGVAHQDIAGIDIHCRNYVTIGGSVVGLGAETLSLNSGVEPQSEEFSITGNGPYLFAVPLLSGTEYTVSVLVQPTGKDCMVSRGSGTTGNFNVDNIDVSCTDVCVFAGNYALENPTRDPQIPSANFSVAQPDPCRATAVNTAGFSNAFDINADGSFFYSYDSSGDSTNDVGVVEVSGTLLPQGTVSLSVCATDFNVCFDDVVGQRSLP